MTALSPTTSSELAQIVRDHPHVITYGAGTKPALSDVGGFTRISTRRLSGVIEYDPEEFTFTALAGTSVREIIATLAERGQHLPFDPPLANAGATLGGTVCAGMEGPGRFRFGGIRDFILGVRFVDGQGRLLRMGGKVVKNAAGFDVPKFFIGSLGSFGALAEITFKVFPNPRSRLTLKLDAPNATEMMRVFQAAANTSLEFEALDGSLSDGAVYARLAGPTNALVPMAAHVLERWRGCVLPDTEAASLWQNFCDFRWAKPGALCWKIPLTPGALPAIAADFSTVETGRIWVGSGGNVAFLSFDPEHTSTVENILVKCDYTALTILGNSRRWHGPRKDFEIHRALKSAMDPLHRFPELSS